MDAVTSMFSRAKKTSQRAGSTSALHEPASPQPQDLPPQAVDALIPKAASASFSSLKSGGSVRPKFLRLMWIDNAGIRRCRVVVIPSDISKRTAFLLKLQEEGVGLTKAVMAFPGYGDIIAPNCGFGPAGENRLLPDLSTVKQLPWRPNHALVHTILHDPTTGQPNLTCPRSALRRALAALGAAAPGVSLAAGFEVEFLLLRPPPPPGSALPVPVDNLVYCAAAGVEAQADLLDQLVSTLERMGLEVEQLHKEAAGGQYELALRYGAIEEACDGVHFAREAISAVAAAHGLVASFLPKYDLAQAGNGAHVHLSLWRDGANLLEATAFDGEGEGEGEGGAAAVAFDATVEGFMAGILAHLPALLAFCTPSVNSFRRVAEGCWAGVFQCWGVDNREAPLRLIQPPCAGAPATNFEVKALDASANAHLALAALVAAGIDGIKKGMKLPPPCNEDPAAMTDSSKKPLRLPATLPECLVLARADNFSPVREILTEECVAAALGVRDAEVAYFEGKDFTEEVATLYNKY